MINFFWTSSPKRFIHFSSVTLSASYIALQVGGDRWFMMLFMCHNSGEVNSESLILCLLRSTKTHQREFLSMKTNAIFFFFLIISFKTFVLKHCFIQEYNSMKNVWEKRNKIKPKLFGKYIYQAYLLHAVMYFLMCLSIHLNTNVSHNRTCVNLIRKMALVCKSLPKMNHIYSYKLNER